MPAAEVKTIVFSLTVIVPSAITSPQPPVKVICQLYTPATVGTPPIVIIPLVPPLLTQPPVTPAGKPVMVAPVALVVVYIMSFSAWLIHSIWSVVFTGEYSDIVLGGVVVIEPLAVTVPQPPVKVTVYGHTPTVAGDTPLIVTTPVFGPLLAQLPLIPAGKPVKVAPVAQVVL